MLRLEAEPGAHRLGHADLVDAPAACPAWRHRRSDTCVFGSAPKPVAAPENSFDSRGDLGMDLHADDDLPIAGGAADQHCCRCLMRSKLLAHRRGPVRANGSCRPPRLGQARTPVRLLDHLPRARTSVSSSNGRPISCSASGRPSAEQAGRHRDAGQARHVHRHGERVVEVHLDRVVRALLRRARRRRMASPA